MYYIISVLLIFLFLCGLRNIKGPTLWDRLLGLNLVSTKIILIIALFATVRDIDYLLDLAIVYALTGFICTIFIASFIRERHSLKKKSKEE